MDKKTFAIGVMTVTAVILFIAQFLPLQPASAATAIKDRDYQLVTARVAQGGEGLYVADNRNGMIAVFTWDASARRIVVRAVRPINEIFIAP
jgi:hypothetical protein